MKETKLTTQELGELRIMHDIIKREQWKLGLVKENTAVVHNGIDWVKTQENIISLFNNAWEDFIGGICASKKITGKVSVDMAKGVIIKQDESKNS